MPNSAVEAIDAAASEVERLRKLLKRKSQSQVRSNDEQFAIKSTAMAWFENHKPLLDMLDADAFVETDKLYLSLLEGSGRASSRSKSIADLSELRRQLVQLRSAALTGQGSDPAPDFSKLIADPAMQAILIGRWTECVNCLRAPAPLAATVMMGGFLEGLLLARVNRETNLAPIFKANTAPKDKQGRPKPLRDWVLYDFISVAQELRWINVSTASVGHALRDYRNYIHPQKQLSDNVMLDQDDAAMWWMIAKAIMRQLLK